MAPSFNVYLLPKRCCGYVADCHHHGAVVHDAWIQRADWWNSHPPVVAPAVQTGSVLLRATEENTGEYIVTFLKNMKQQSIAKKKKPCENLAPCALKHDLFLHSKALIPDLGTVQIKLHLYHE